MEGAIERTGTLLLKMAHFKIAPSNLCYIKDQMNQEERRQLDKYYPERGPCAFCGHKDARHRLWDTIIDRHEAGDSMTELAKDYDKPRKAIKLVLDIRPYKRRKKS